ncbi:hypothetical protein Taro_000651, partial [Colocasia esculenta]|nr:hypothetical protein [Colocasia esculenta]
LDHGPCRGAGPAAQRGAHGRQTRGRAGAPDQGGPPAPVRCGWHPAGPARVEPAPSPVGVTSAGRSGGGCPPHRFGGGDPRGPVRRGLPPHWFGGVWPPPHWSGGGPPRAGSAGVGPRIGPAGVGPRTGPAGVPRAGPARSRVFLSFVDFPRCFCHFLAFLMRGAVRVRSVHAYCSRAWHSARAQCVRSVRAQLGRPDSGGVHRFPSPGGVYHLSVGPTWVFPLVVYTTGDMHSRWCIPPDSGARLDIFLPVVCTTGAQQFSEEDSGERTSLQRSDMVSLPQDSMGDSADEACLSGFAQRLDFNIFFEVHLLGMLRKSSDLGLAYLCGLLAKEGIKFLSLAYLCGLLAKEEFRFSVDFLPFWLIRGRLRGAILEAQLVNFQEILVHLKELLCILVIFFFNVDLLLAFALHLAWQLNRKRAIMAWRGQQHVLVREGDLRSQCFIGLGLSFSHMGFINFRLLENLYESFPQFFAPGNSIPHSHTGGKPLSFVG